MESGLGRRGRGAGDGWEDDEECPRRGRASDPHHECGWARVRAMLCPKKVGTLPVDGSDEQKRTNEIGMAIPLLQTCVIEGKDITGDALLTQRAIANYVIEQGAHYHFTVKGNQPELQRDIALLFQTRGTPDFVEPAAIEHGRIETRRIWCSAALNDYLDFPHTGQVFCIERESIDKKTGETRLETALGITS